MNRMSRVNGMNKVKNERIEQITSLRRIIPNGETPTNSSFFFDLYKTEGHHFMCFYIRQ